MNSKLYYKLTKEDETLYVKELLQRKFLFSSRLIKKLKPLQGSLMLDGKACRLRDRGLAGQTLSCEYPQESSYFEPEDIALEIAFEDDDILVINKQPFIVVHPTKNYQEHTLANAVAFYMKQKGESYRLRFVNRLDRDTSGLIIVAKNSHAQDLLSRSDISKKYLAIVHGELEGCGTVDAPIAKDPCHAARRAVLPEGQHSVTHYKVLENAPGATLLELKLDTGRTHQIRTHMRHIGHIIVGDELYGSEAFPELFRRQALHSFYLELPSPRNGKMISIQTEMPEDMQKLWNTLKNSRSL